MEEGDISSWMELISRSQDEEVLLNAKQEYQKLSGPVFQDDKSYEPRMGLFLEWYLFNYHLPQSGRIPLMEYLEVHREQLDEKQLSSIEALSHSLHGIFRVTQLSTSHLRVCELFEDKEFRVIESRGNLLFNKNDLFEGNLFELGKDHLFSGNFVYHPPAAVKYIKARVKTVRAAEKESANKLKLREKEVAATNKGLQACERAMNKLEAKIQKASKVEKREKLKNEYREKERELNSIRARLEQENSALDEFRKGEMGEQLLARRFELMQRLSYMSLKWERSRQIDINDIYSD